jgi:hypothetical protein
VSSWRATLEEDPFAAMKLRHEVTGVDHISVSRDGDTCTTMVLRGAMYEPCGLSRGDDGRCADGH